MKIIKNVDTVSHTYAGQEIQPSEQYTIQKQEESRWANDDSLLEDIANAKAIVNDGTNDLVGTTNQINFLKDEIAKEVITQFESKEFDLKIFCGKADVDTTSGEAHILIKVGGTPGTDYRYFDGGEAFFDQAHLEDRVIKVEIIDHDNILGYGVDTVVKSYIDDEVDEANRGWYTGIDEYGYNGINSGSIKLETMGFYGQVPSGLYLHVVGLKDSANKTGKFFINVFSGKRS